MSLRVADIIVAAVLMTVGGLVAFDSWQRGSGWGPDGPRPGFFPFIMALVVLGGCAVVIARALRRPAAPRTPMFLTLEGLRPVLVVLVPAILMVALTEVTGLYVAAMLYLVAYIRWAGEFRWRTALAVGISVPVAFYVLFEKLFLIPMPQGWLGGMLGF